MKKYVKKVYLSIMLIVFSLLTMVATTYAWVGLLTSSTFDEFEIKLQETDNPEANEYGIELSLDGINFYDSISQVELRRRLLYNIDSTVKYKDVLSKDLNGEYIVSDNKINDYFRKHNLSICTTHIDGSGVTKKLSTFTDMRGNTTTNFFKFDLYVGIYKIGEESSTGSDKKLSLYLRDSVLSSATDTNSSGIYESLIFNPITYPSNSIEFRGKQILNNDMINSIGPSTTISNKVNVDVSTACRVGIEKMLSVEKGHPEQYSFGNFHNGLYIYQNGNLYPTYDSARNLYDFGGILPSEYNFARLYYNSTHPDTPLGEVPENVLNRGDIVFSDDGVVNRIVNEDDNVTTARMIRFRIYFWFEGWDSNCFDVIDSKKVTLNLSFSTKKPNED